jgi:hypothetical protein
MRSQVNSAYLGGKKIKLETLCHFFKPGKTGNDTICQTLIILKER